MDHWVKARGLGYQHVNPLTQQPFRFDHPGGSPLKDTPGEVNSDCWPLPHQPLKGQDCNRHWRDQRPPLPWLTSPSQDHGFDIDRCSLSMASSISSMSDRSEGSQHSWSGRWHWEDGTHMKINLPVFKDEDAKDAVTYKSWRWDLTMYWHVGCRDCTLLQDRCNIRWHVDNLDEHYNNVKALDALNQESFQLRMVDKETILDWGVHLSRHLQVLAASFPNHFPPDWVAELKRGCFYGGLPKCLKAMVAYLKVGPQVGTYSDYLRAAWEAEKENSMELPRGSRAQTTNNAPKPWATSFFPLQNLKATSPPPIHQQCVWCIWRKRMPGEMRMKRATIQWESKGYWRIYGALGKGCKGHPSKEEALLSL